jgi:hypothetical protein
MKKKVAVLFSGGLDSTYLVWKNLKEGNDVRPIYIEIENNVDKTILEKNRIELLHDEFKKEFNTEVFYRSEGANIYPINYAVKISVGTSESSLYFKQMPIWIFTLLYCQSLDVDEIQIGYVMNDDAISYLSDIEKMYYSYQPVFDKMKPIAFPLTKHSKNTMAHELPPQYMSLIVSCENPSITGNKSGKFIEYEPCGCCAPCMRIIDSDYYNLGEFPEYYKQPIKNHYVRELRRIGYRVEDKEHGNMLRKALKKPYQLELPFNEEVEVEEFIAAPISACKNIEHTITITPRGVEW